MTTRAYWKSKTFTRQDDDDLVWLYQRAESELGFRSSFGGQLERAANGTMFDTPHAMPDQPLPPPGATARYARLAKALDALRVLDGGLTHCRVLAAVYGPKPTQDSFDAKACLLTDPPELGRVFRHIPELRGSAALGGGTLARALERVVKEKKLATLTTQAKAMLANARSSYAIARKSIE